MNQLKMDIQQTISTLSRGGWSQRRIARELGIDRETVARYRRLARQLAEPKPAISPAGSKPGRASHCEPFESFIKAGLDARLSAQRIYQDLVSEQKFVGSYDSVKRFVRQLQQANPLPFRRMETEPGQEAQVDFGQGAWVVQDGRRRRPHVLRLVLSHSRKGYTEAFWRQTTENFIRGIENAFRHWGGVVPILVIDNLRAAVKKVDWFEPELNPKVISFCEHYGTVILPTKPAMPRHKEKVSYCT
jgi:transposase